MHNFQNHQSDSDLTETDSESDKDETDEIHEMKKFQLQRQFSRRVSVFSKSYDPDGMQTAELDEDSLNTNEEAIANQNYETQVNVKTLEESDKLRNVLLSIVLFKHLDKQNIENILEAMFERKCKKNELIIREGDEGKYFYVIMKGGFDVYKNKCSTNEDTRSLEELDAPVNYGVKVTTYKDKGYFGELSLLYDQVRFVK